MAKLGTTTITGTLSINGTQITATPAELNILDGATVTTAEINKLGGVGTLYHSGNFIAGTDYNPTIGTDTDMTLTGSTVLSSVIITDGVITGFATRGMTAADVGAKDYSTGYFVGNTQFYGTDTTGTYSNAPIEIREVNLVGNTQSTDAYAPALAFHWGNRAQVELMMDATGVLKINGNSNGTLLHTGNFVAGTNYQAPLVAGTDYNPTIGTDTDINASSGNTVVSTVTLTDGVITGFTTRGLTAANLSAYTTAETDAAISTAINNLIAGAPATLDTLDEIAQSLNDNADLYGTITGLLDNKMGIELLNGYEGMTANGANNVWIRTTSLGIIPYASGGSSGLGTSSWPFSTIYGNSIYKGGTEIGSLYEPKNANIQSHISSTSNPHSVSLSTFGVTSTAAELNKLDGYTGSVTELNWLDTLHATGVTNTEFDYLDGVTSNIQTQLNGKQGTITGAATTITGADLTASRALISGTGGKVEVSAVTSTELGYLDGVTSAIQTQLNGKLSIDEFKWRGNGALTSTTTSALMTELLGDDMFDSYISARKTSWSYAGNGDLTDAGGLTELAGTSWLTWTDNSTDNVQGNITALVIAPNTGGSAGGVFIYNDQGSGYSPGWREVWTSMTDGSGSGLDADLLDAQHGSYYLDYNNFTNTPSIPTVYNSSMTVTAGTGLTGGGVFYANQASNSSVTLTHNTAEGYKHIPSAGSSGQILQYSAAGTAQWYTPPWTTNVGTVTSVGMTVPTGLSISGSPITSSGTLALSLTAGYSIPTTTKQGQWDTAYTHSQVTTGNPHSIGYADISDFSSGVTYEALNGNSDVGTGSTQVSRGNHVHGEISNTGAITTSTTPASGDAIIIADSGSSNVLKKGITLGTATNTFLRNNGTFGSVTTEDVTPSVHTVSSATTLYSRNYDRNDVIVCTHAATGQVTFYLDALSEGGTWSAGDMITIVKAGTGSVYIGDSTTGTVYCNIDGTGTTGGAYIGLRYSAVTCIAIDSTNWVIVGNLSSSSVY